MAKTARKAVSPLQAIQATAHPPLKAAPRPISPERQEWRDREYAREVREYYYPKLLTLSDPELLAELSWQKYQVEKRNLSTERLYFRDQVEDLLKRRWAVRTGSELPLHTRTSAREACVALRSLYVIISELPPEARGLPKMVMVLRTQRLATTQSWDLIQHLAELVGSRRYKPYELGFIVCHWSRAWQVGPKRFSFRFDGQRWAVERLLVETRSRPVELCEDQIEIFKRGTGCLFRIPLWEKSIFQASLPTLIGVAWKPPKEKESEKPYRAGEGQLDLLAHLLKPIWEMSQDSLFPDLEAAPWDGVATQQEMLFK